MGILAALVIGAIAGWLAGLIVRGARNQPGSEQPQQNVRWFPRDLSRSALEEFIAPIQLKPSKNAIFAQLKSRMVGYARTFGRLCPQLSEAAQFRPVRGRTRPRWQRPAHGPPLRPAVLPLSPVFGEP